MRFVRGILIIGMLGIALGSELGRTQTAPRSQIGSINPSRFHEVARTKAQENLLNPYRWSPDGAVGIRIDKSPVMYHVWELSILGTAGDSAIYLVRVTAPDKWSFSPDGQRMAIASFYDDARNKPQRTKAADAKTLQIWPTNAKVSQSAIPDNDCVESITWSPDGKWIAVSSTDNGFSLWDATTQKRLFLDMLNYRSSVLWSPDSRMVAAMGNNATSIYSVGSLPNGTPQTWRFPNTAGKLAWSPDSTKVAIPNNDGTVQVWETRTQQLLDTIKGHSSRIAVLVWSKDNRTLASVSFDLGNSLTPRLIVQDTSAGKVLATLSELYPLGLEIAWDYNGTGLILTEMDGGRIRILDAKTGKLREIAKGAGFAASSVSMDGRWLAYTFRVEAGNMDISIFDTTSGQTVAKLPSKAPVYVLQWSPDARYLVSVDLEDNVILWSE